jgi:arylsulfate sulfotransferase
VSQYELWRRRSQFFCILCLIVLASGCAQRQDPDPAPISVSPQKAALATGQSIQFTATGDPYGVTWSVIGVSFSNSGPAVLVAGGTIDASGLYTGPSGSPSLLVTVTATSKRDPTQYATASLKVVAPGQVTATNNVQVAQYTISPPAVSASVSVQFGTDTSYGLTTWAQPTSQLGGPVSLYVAGMRANTLYHMRGMVQFADGTQFIDADQTFTTGSLPEGVSPNLTVTVTPGMTPQSGVEFLDLVNPVNPNATGPSMAVVSDLSGNVLWTYTPVLIPGVVPAPIKLLPNGHFLLGFFNSVLDGSDSMLQEVDLGGNLIWQLTPAQLNTALAAATCSECKVKVIGTHHDFVMLPNGHLVVIASTQMTLSDGTTPVGDVLIDLGDMENVSGKNPNHLPQPVWAWNEFNHLDTNRRPYAYPDWTHTNALIYSSDDGNLILSSRSQSWLVKIDYNNGAGGGDVLWRLGYQGDFTLLNPDGSPDPGQTDWFFAQHGPSFVSTNTTGNFSLAVFDDGDDRGVALVPGGTCGVAGQPACFSTVPILQLNEAAKTATLVFHATTPDYSSFGGNAEVLKNGNVEYAEAQLPQLFPSYNAAVFEVTQTTPPQTVWEMKIAGQFAYRAMRLPSLYPGVQW